MTKNITSIYELKEYVSQYPNCINLFYSKNHGPSENMITVAQKIALLEKDHQVKLGIISINDIKSCRKSLNITAIPCLWIIKNGTLIDILINSDPRSYLNRANDIFNNDIKSTIDMSLLDLISAGEKETNDAVENILAKNILNVCIKNNDKQSLFCLGTNFLMDNEIIKGTINKYNIKSENFAIINSKIVIKEATAEELSENSEIIAIKSTIIDELDNYIKNLVNNNSCILFIKGSKEAPYCKYSKQLVNIFNEHNIMYTTFDVFSNNAVRERIKILYDWPTFPQVYVRGKLIGGIDVIKIILEENANLFEALAL